MMMQAMHAVFTRANLSILFSVLACVCFLSEAVADFTSLSFVSLVKVLILDVRYCASAVALCANPC
jgi:hypothetical protein